MRYMSMTKKTHVRSLSKILNLVFLFLAVFINFSSLALEVHPKWLSQEIDKVERLSEKNPSEAIEHANKLLNEQADKLNDFGKAAIYGRIAEQYYYLGKLTKSLEFIERSKTLSPPPLSYTGISLLLTHGAVLGSMGKSAEAMELFLQAEQRSKDAENKALLANTYSYIANSYAITHNEIEALKFYHKTYILFEELNDELELMYLKAQMAKSYKFLGDLEKSIELSNEVVKYFRSREFYFDEIYVHHNLAQSYIERQEFNNAEKSYKRMIELSVILNDTTYISLTNFGLTKVYTYKKQHQKARKHWNNYLKIKIKNESPYYRLEHFLVEANLELLGNNIPLAQAATIESEKIIKSIDHEGTMMSHIRLLDIKIAILLKEDDYKSAYYFLKKIRALEELYKNSERELIRSKYKVMFDTDQEILKNKLLEQEKQFSEIALVNADQRQWIQGLIITIFSILLLVLTFFIYRQIRTTKKLNVLANTDSLTKLANRRYTFNYAEEKLDEAKQSSSKFSILVFDIDLFKQVNDTYGHSAGDYALIETSKTANKYVRDNDILGRVGGEEFLLILPNASVEEAYEVAERIRTAFQQDELIFEGNKFNLTASFGIAQLTAENQTFIELFQQADEALYKAKNNGRNQTVIAD